MKRSVLLFLLVIISSSCTIRDISKDEPTINERDILEFKTVFLQDCLTQSFGREITSQIFYEDISTSSELRLGIRAYEKIRYLADSIAIEIKKDSLEWTNQICPNCPDETIPILRGDGIIGKRTFKFCLEYFGSKELDLITRQKLRKDSK